MTASSSTAEPNREPSAPLSLDELCRLGEQLDVDRESDWSSLVARDTALAADCLDEDPVASLRRWLHRVSPADGEQGMADAAVGLMVAISAALGFAAVAGFLMANDKGLVNLLWFFAVFVLLQWLLAMAGLVALAWGSAGGTLPTVSINPARWWLLRKRSVRRVLEAFSDLGQLLVLRYGQLLGIGFVLGSMLAFIVVPAFNQLSFVWSSTYRLTDDAVLGFAQVVSWPWSGWLEAATVDAQLVADSRYNPTLIAPLQDKALEAGGWWAFLLLSLLTWALLPRWLLWWWSRRLYRRRLQSLFATYPGADLVLTRMRSPQVSTGADAVAQPTNIDPVAPGSEGVVVVDWSDALGAAKLSDYGELQGLDQARMLRAGLSFEADEQAAAALAAPGVTLVLVIAKSWEPPLSDLGDFLARVPDGLPCVVFLRPLGDADIPADRLDDWRGFSAALGDRVQVKALNSVQEEVAP